MLTSHYILFNYSSYLLGSGDFYCSGNDLNNFTQIPEGGMEKMAKDAGELLRSLALHYSFLDVWIHS